MRDRSGSFLMVILISIIVLFVVVTLFEGIMTGDWGAFIAVATGLGIGGSIAWIICKLSDKDYEELTKR